MPAASERRSLLTGIPHGEPSREKSGQRLYSARPEQGFSIEGPRPCALSLELPGAERSGEAYRRSLSHDCTIASSPLAELDVCLDRMAAPILPRRVRTRYNTLCPQRTFQELPVMGKEYASLDRRDHQSSDLVRDTCLKRAF